MSSYELLPCPFCGGEAELKEYKPNVSGVAICKKCGARSPIRKNDHTGGWSPKAVEAWNTRAEREAATLDGTRLTAEQVRDAHDRHWHDLPAEYDMPEASALPEYSHDWQAIADELNAALGNDKCELYDCEGSFSALNRPVWRCDCGAFMTQYTDATTYHKPRFCPNCGKAVKR